MEPNQVNPSPENAWIPQGIPTGVFVANNQVPAQTSAMADKPVQNTIPTEPTQVPVVTPVTETQASVTQASVTQVVVPSWPAKEGPLDKVFKGLARFFAKIMGQPDPITWASNANSATTKKAEDIIGKVRGVANQVVAKASDAAGKAVDTVNQATQQIQQVIPQAPTTAPVQPTPPAVEQPVQPIPPVQS